MKETSRIEAPCNTAEILKLYSKFVDLKKKLFPKFLLGHSELSTRETRHTEPPCNKAGKLKFHLKL